MSEVSGHEESDHEETEDAGAAGKGKGKGKGGKNIYKRQDLVASVVAKTGLPRGKAVIVVDSILESMAGTLKTGREIRLVGFGSFVVVERKASKGHDPRTGAEIDIAAGKSVRFRAGKQLRESIAVPQE